MDTSDRLVEILLSAKAPISGEEMGRTLGLSRTAVWKAVRRLRDLGYEVNAVPRKGYLLQTIPDRLYSVVLRRNLKCRRLAAEIEYFETIDSTNREAKKSAAAGAKDGLLVIAEEQTHGRGRLDRTWTSPKGANLLFSLVCRPPIPPQRVFRLNMVASVSIAEAVESLTPLTPEIKWPNDIYIGRRKLAGLLTEFSAGPDSLDYAVVGIGLNVNFDPKNHPEISDTATSVYAETGRRWSRVELLAGILGRMDVWYDKLLAGEDGNLASEWNRRSLVLGREVEIRSFDDVLRGTAETIDESGALILTDENGSQVRVTCGDVSLRLA